MSTPSAFRFLTIVLKPPLELVVGFVGLVALAIWLGRTNPDDMEQVFAYTLLFQMFAAATGYRERAIRGHFDPLLTVGWRRSNFATAHWLASIVPGLITWLIVTVIVMWFKTDAIPRSLTWTGTAAFVYVSSAAWAFALPLTRYVTGVVWLILLVVSAGGGYLESVRQAYVDPATGWIAAIHQVAASLVCPVFLIARPEAADFVCVLLVFAAAATCIVSGVLFVSILDAPLRNPS